MATADKSSFDGFIGTVGDIRTYVRNGVIVKSKKRGKSTKPPTPAGKTNTTKMKLYNDFRSPLQKFIAVGFAAESKRLRKTTNDLFSSYTMKNCIKGSYPNQEFDYAKALVSQGEMPLTPNVKVVQTEDGLHFSWDTNLIENQQRQDDQVMLVVLFPELKTAQYDVCAGKRLAGEVYFEVLKKETTTVIETYISFINHATVSNSQYTGQLILPAASKRRSK